MSIPLLIALALFAVIIAAAVGVWQARDRGPAAVQSSVMLLAVVVAAALLVLFLFRGRFGW